MAPLPSGLVRESSMNVAPAGVRSRLNTAVSPWRSDGEPSLTRAVTRLVAWGASRATLPAVQVGESNRTLGASVVPATPCDACSAGVPARRRFHSTSTSAWSVARILASVTSGTASSVSKLR